VRYEDIEKRRTDKMEETKKSNRLYLKRVKWDRKNDLKLYQDSKKDEGRLKGDKN